MMVLGGGGYRISNVARCWAFETGQILGGMCCTPLNQARHGDSVLWQPAMCPADPRRAMQFA